MTTDMLRLAGEISGGRAEGFAHGGVDESRRPLRAPAPSAPMLDLRALVTRTVVPHLSDRLKARFSDIRPPATAAPAPGKDSCRDENSDGLVDELVEHLLCDDLAGLCRTIDAVHACGRPLERVYLDLLVPAAAIIDRLVNSDGCSSAAGTLAFCNLQRVLRRYADAFYREGRCVSQGSRALLVPTRAMGGLSTFGLPLAADFLRRAGWDAWVEPSFRSASFEATVEGQWFDLVQVLAADDDRDEALVADELRDAAAGIRSIRCRGANPHVVVVACGSALARDPDLVVRLGADHAGVDPLSGLRYFQRWPEDIPHTQHHRRRHLS